MSKENKDLKTLFGPMQELRFIKSIERLKPLRFEYSPKGSREKMVAKKEVESYGMLRLYTTYGLTLDEIGEIYGITRSAVQQRLAPLPYYQVFKTQQDIKRRELKKKITKPTKEQSVNFQATVSGLAEKIDLEVNKIMDKKGVSWYEAFNILREQNPELLIEYQQQQKKFDKAKRQAQALGLGPKGV